MPAPVESVTWPTIALVVSPCAEVSAGNKKKHKIAAISPKVAFRIKILVPNSMHPSSDGVEISNGLEGPSHAPAARNDINRS